VDLDYLEQVLQTQKIKACMVTPNFQNPIGSLMPDDQKARLCALAHRHGFYVIEDDIYGDCGHSARAPSPLKAFDQHNRVVYCTSFAKSLAPGLRLGFCIPGPLQQKMVQAKQRSTLGGPALLQETLAQFLSAGGYQRHLLKFRKSIANQVHSYRELILQSFPEGSRVSQPEGGYFLWVQMPPGCSALHVFEQALKQKIGISPGSAFSLRGAKYQDSIRISCATPIDLRIKKSLATLGELCVVSTTDKSPDRQQVPSKQK
jgi:DNA-binding transcriptional MocR family regulator